MPNLRCDASLGIDSGIPPDIFDCTRAQEEETPMKVKPTVLSLGVGIVLVSLLVTKPLRAQDATTTLSGTITNVSGEIVPSAKISIKNVATGQSSETQTNSTGHYAVPNLMAGEYEVSVVAKGFATKLDNLTLAGDAPQTLNLTLSADSAQPQAPAMAAPSESLPNAPSSTATQPSLGDLGFTPEQTQGNAKEQALLDKRTHMLKIHQRMGLITTIPLLATLITSVNAGGKSTSATSRDLHTALGAVTGDLYFITAYYAIRAPRVAGTETRGPIRVHKALAWIHGPGMVLTPILGIMAYDQKSNGEKVHGIASAHGPVAIVTAGAFGAALLSVSLKF
jgi:hypothetical protein